MNARKFLQAGGTLLVLIAILGFVEIIGPDAKTSIFGARWYFDNGENWAHLIIGVVALTSSVALSPVGYRNLARFLGIIALLFGFYSFFISTNFFGVNLEKPADTIFHVALGLWALWAGRKG